MSASAALNWSRVAIRTERLASSCNPPPKADPRARSPNATWASAPHSRQAAGASHRKSRSDFELLCGIFVDPDEVAEGHRKEHVVGFGEWVDPQCILEASDENCEAERIKAGIGE